MRTADAGRQKLSYNWQVELRPGTSAARVPSKCSLNLWSHYPRRKWPKHAGFSLQLFIFMAAQIAVALL